MRRFVMSLVVCLSATWSEESLSEVISFHSQRWEISAVQSKETTFLGRPCLMLKGGVAWITDAAFTDGILEFDMAFTGERGFMGAVWRLRG